MRVLISVANGAALSARRSACAVTTRGHVIWNQPRTEANFTFRATACGLSRMRKQRGTCLSCIRHASICHLPGCTGIIAGHYVNC